MLHRCIHKVKNAKVCSGCLTVSYCGDLCAQKDWEMRHRFECIGMKRKREPTQDELLQWAEENPSGWDDGTTPRRWPADWIYKPEYFDPEDSSDSPEPEYETSYTPSSDTGKEDEDSIPPTVILFDSDDPSNRRKRPDVEGPARRKLNF